MKAEKRKNRSCVNVADEFSDLPVSRQRKWQLRMRKEGKCGICARPLYPSGCPIHKHEKPASLKIFGVVGPCIANMLKAGMTIDEVAQDMNRSRMCVINHAKRYGVDVSAQFKKPGRRGYNGWNLRIFLKESLNGTKANPIQAPVNDA